MSTVDERQRARDGELRHIVDREFSQEWEDDLQSSARATVLELIDQLVAFQGDRMVLVRTAGVGCWASWPSDLAVVVDEMTRRRADKSSACKPDEIIEVAVRRRFLIATVVTAHENARTESLDSGAQT